jgi:putative endonuclease
MASKKNGTLYVGVTTNLIQRTHQHREHTIKGFTDKYHVNKLVYFETYDDLNTAIAREKQLKRWKRSWKIALIEKDNPNWLDLFDILK